MTKKDHNQDHIHFVGIGGSGMSALAEIAQDAGCFVSGSDQTASDVTNHLAARGITFYEGHSESNLSTTTKLIFSSAIKDENIELTLARARGIPTMHRSDYLAEIMATRKAITVAGTHGKTTTTALMAHVFSSLGLDPGFAIGGRLVGSMKAGVLGSGAFFIAEADESDGTLSKYKPFVSVLTNVEDDHLDHFGGIAKIESLFKQYLESTANDGCVVVNWDHDGSRRIAHAVQKDRLAYGFTLGADIRCLSFETKSGKTVFDAVIERDRVKTEIPLWGRYNIHNALCCLGVCRALGLDVNQAAASLASFPGVARRQQVLCKRDDLVVIDDYAHNPGKIAAFINGLKSGWPGYEINIVFQNHRFSRLQFQYDQIVSAFHDADRVFICPVYSAGENDPGIFTVEKLAADIAIRSKTSAVPFQNPKHLLSTVSKDTSRPKLIATVGAGNVWRIGVDLLSHV